MLYPKPHQVQLVGVAGQIHSTLEFSSAQDALEDFQAAIIKDNVGPGMTLILRRRGKPIKKYHVPPHARSSGHPAGTNNRRKS
jgi:hypothetical protein